MNGRMEEEDEALTLPLLSRAYWAARASHLGPRALIQCRPSV